MTLQGLKIIVTGAASGMGAAMIRGFAEAGAEIVAFYNSKPGDEAMAGLDEAAQARVRWLKCNVSDQAEVDAAVDKAVSLLGGLHVMVNSAGIAPNAMADEITLDAWEAVFAINSRGTFLTNRAAFRHLKDRGGKIINFASATGVNGTVGKAHYAASKGAVLAWTRSIAKEWARYGVRVNAICPAIWTPMYENTRASMSPEGLAAHDVEMARMIPLGGKLGAVEDFIPYMVFLAGPGSDFITGQTIKIDGGLLMLS